jgi:hypothetical protein
MWFKTPALNSDLGTRVMEFTRLARRVAVRDAGLKVLLAALLCAVSSPVWAVHLSWHEYSQSYEVYLGVVPASAADRDSDLTQMHKIAPHGDVERSDALRHVMVAVFRMPGMERVLGARVTAEVVENDLIHTKSANKNLDMMMLHNGASYCNFFTLHWNGNYRIKLRISEPGKAPEWVTFNQEETELRD